MNYGIGNVKAKSSGGGASFLTSSVDATFSDNTYTLALTNFSDTPKVDDYVAYIDNNLIQALYKVSAIGSTNATLTKIGNVVDITKQITLNGSEDGWQWYKNNSLSWAKWGYIHIDDLGTYSANDIAVAYSKEAKVISEYELAQNSAVSGICFSIANDLVIRLNLSNINTLADFKAYLSNNPITIQYK